MSCNFFSLQIYKARISLTLTSFDTLFNIFIPTFNCIAFSVVQLFLIQMAEVARNRSCRCACGSLISFPIFPYSRARARAFPLSIRPYSLFFRIVSLYKIIYSFIPSLILKTALLEGNSKEGGSRGGGAGRQRAEQTCFTRDSILKQT